MIKYKPTIIATTVTIIGLALSACAGSIDQSSNSGFKSMATDPTVTKIESADFAQITYQNRYLLINNVWNKGIAKPGYRQEIYQGIANGKPFCGWSWQWDAGSNVAAYPEIDCGDSPWNPPTGLASDFPFKAGSKKVTVDLDMTLEASGIYNVAFEFWATRGKPAGAASISHEIMIWTVDEVHDTWTWARKLETFECDGIIWDVYADGGHGDESQVNSNKWDYVAFVARTPFLKGQLHFDQFIDLLIRQNVLTQDNYIADLSLGNEVWDGTGFVRLNTYSVTVE